MIKNRTAQLIYQTVYLTLGDEDDIGPLFE